MRRRRLIVGALLTFLVAAASVAVSPPAGAVTTNLADDRFRTDSTVLVLKNRTSVADAVTQATPPESFCYVGVAWPASIGADWKATATWALDCRSLADPNAPAPDIFSVLMDVRIYQGEYTAWERGREVAHVSCSSGRTNPSCSATTEEPLAFGAPYYTMLHVQVALTGGTNPEGEFYTDPIRRI